MPGKRRAGKKVVNVWLTDKEKAVLKETYTRLGFENLADYMRSLIPSEDAISRQEDGTNKLTPEDRSKVQKAAEMLGCSVNEFLNNAAVRVAEQLTKEKPVNKGTKKKP